MATQTVYPDGEMVRKLRDKLKLNQKEFADAADGLSVRALQNIEAVKRVQFDTLRRIASGFTKKGLSVSAEELELTTYQSSRQITHSKTLPVIHADSSSVDAFIKENDLFAKSQCVDLHLYTFETLAWAAKEALCNLPQKIHFRVLMRHPSEGPRRKEKVALSIASMTSIMHRNPKVSFSVRFYESDPLLRSFLFRPGESGSRVGLLGLYRWDPGFSPEYDFVGAEKNLLLHVSDKNDTEKLFFDVFQSRFDHTWRTLTQVRAVIFDLDGLLIDSMEFYYEAYAAALEPYGVTVDRTLIYLREGEKMENTVKHAFSEVGKQSPSSEKVQKIVNDVKKRFQSLFTVQFFPGALEMLNSLAERGVKLALVTGSRTLKETFRNHVTFLKMFAVIVTGDETTEGKPTPQPYELAVKKLGIEKENCCVIENAPFGIDSAVAANITCFAVNGRSPLPASVFKERKASASFDSLNDLKRLLAYADANMQMKTFYDYFKLYIDLATSK